MRKYQYANSEAVTDAAYDIRENGFPEGLSCGWWNLDPYFKLDVSGTLNVISGFPSSGKSVFLDNIACHMAVNYGWNIVMYSPESYPPEHQALELIEKITGKTAFKRGALLKMSDKDYSHGEMLYRKHFRVISADDDAYTFEEIIAGIDERCNKGEKINMVVLDPWNELENGRPNGMSETDYIGVCLMKARRLARKHKISFWIVAHPAKPAKKNDSGSYDPPDLYDLAGSAHWRNKTDYGLIVHRNTLEGCKVTVFVKKIKKRFYGNPGEVYFEFMTSCGKYRPVQPEMAI